MSNALRFWLSQELKRRKWSQRELARQAGISQAFVNRVISGSLPPSVNFCHKVAQALGEPPDKLLRLAGILPAASPAAPEDDATLQELVELARSLPPDARQQVLDYVRFLYQKGKR